MKKGFKISDFFFYVSSKKKKQGRGIAWEWQLPEIETLKFLSHSLLSLSEHAKRRCHLDPFWPLEHNIYLVLFSLILREVTDKISCKNLLCSLCFGSWIQGLCPLHTKITFTCFHTPHPPPLLQHLTLLEICRNNKELHCTLCTFLTSSLLFPHPLFCQPSFPDCPPVLQIMFPSGKREKKFFPDNKHIYYYPLKCSTKQKITIHFMKTTVSEGDSYKLKKPS